MLQDQERRAKLAEAERGDSFTTKERIKLSDHFTYGKLFRFTVPSVIMTIFESVYVIVDGFFVSNFAGSTALAAVNLIFPPLMIVSAFGFMLAAGGSALVGKFLGMQDHPRAENSFSLLTYTCAVLGIVIAVLMALFMPQVAHALGADGQLLTDSVLYGRILCVGMMPYMLQYHFQLFFITAEKPKLGLYFTVVAGCTNMVLDFLLVGVCGFGLAGAAWATVASQCIGGMVPLIYFFRLNDSLLRLGRAKMDWYCLRQSSYNGIAEFLASISASLVNLVFNFELLRLLGEDGVAAYGVIMYFSMIFTSVFFGYCIGIAPVVSFHYGADNRPELKNLLRKSFVVEMGACILGALCSYLLAIPCSKLFVGYDPDLLALTIHAFRIYSLSYIFMGFGYFSQVFFTALNNGFVAGVISIIRIFILQVGLTILMAELFGAEALWYSMFAAQIIGFAVAWIFLLKYKDRYGYL